MTDRDEWIDRRAVDNQGGLLGVVVDVYEDSQSRCPAWLAISTGFFGTRIAIAPVHGASRLGEDVVIAHDRRTITTAPGVDIVVAVEPTQQRRLVDHYARPVGAPWSDHHAESSP